MDGTWGKCADLNLVHKKGWANVLLFVIKPNFTFFQVQIEGLFRNTFKFAKPGFCQPQLHLLAHMLFDN